MLESASTTQIVPFQATVDQDGRTSPSAMPIDTRREVTKFTREQLVRKSRWLCNNLGLFKRFVKGTAQFSIGNGITHIPMTSSQPFNEAIDTYFTNWANNAYVCDVRGRHSFWRSQKSACRWMFRDGDMATLKVDQGEGPQIQAVEAHRFGNLVMAPNDYDAKGYIDGIKIDPKTGRTKSIRFIEDLDPRRQDMKGERFVDASAVVHLFDCERSSQVRGVPWLYHGINSALDILDMVALEKYAAKIHAALAGAIHRRAADAGKATFGGEMKREKGTNPQGQPRVIAFEKFFGGAAILQLGIDEEFKLLTSERTSEVFTGFIDWLIRDIAWGFGVSPEFIWACAGMGGPNYRGILEDAKWFFEDVQDLIATDYCMPIYLWVVADGIERNLVGVPAPEDWDAVAWQGPMKITVDQGKEGNLELERLKMGCGTWDEYWAARGKTGKKMVRKRIDELADAMKYAEEKKVPFEYVMNLQMGGSGSPEEKEKDKKKKDPFGDPPKDDKEED
jgi:capsid protein